MGTLIKCKLRDEEVDIEIQSWIPYVYPILGGPPEACSPAEGGYGDWVILDENGEENEALMQTLTPDETQMIDEVCFTEMEQ